MRVALIGAGFIGSVHAVNLAAHPDVRFDVFDVDTTRARSVADRHGTGVVASLDDAFDPARFDAVLIASSTDTHAAHLRRAADAGLAVFCEKPVDLDLDRAREVSAHVAARGVPAMVDFNRRFDRDYAHLRELVRSGDLGDVELVQLTSRGPSMPPLEYVAVSGGQMRDQAVHFFDLARWITGAEPVEVTALGAALADPRITEHGDVDTSVTSVRMSTGALVQIDCVRRTAYGYDERIEVHGSAGMAEARRHRDGAVTRYGAGRVVEDGLHPGWFERVRPTYAAALDAFVTAVREGVAPSPSLADGLVAQAVAEAATAALTSGRTEPVLTVTP
ncbi:Gfo/Idh/MocA family protein [Kineococcus sp. SYSU DK001]|uniref:Gfo/Idh/MocA family protein n=1 Tax=Kineococcus sp. SYSU DK001 TaxID=3383122 RepID=UPI003D7D3250